MRSYSRTYYIEGILSCLGPGSYRFICSILESIAARFNRHHLSTQHLHSHHIERLTFHILLAHIYCTFHIKKRSSCGCCHSMLSGSRLCDNLGLTHSLGKKYLTEHIINLMSSRVIQILSLEIYLRSILLTQSLCIIQRSLSSHILLKVIMILLHKLRIFYRRFKGRFNLLKCVLKRFRHELSSVLSVVSLTVHILMPPLPHL